MKILFIPLQFRWAYVNNILSMSNANDGTSLDSKIEITENCMIMREQGTATYFSKD